MMYDRFLTQEEKQEVLWHLNREWNETDVNIRPLLLRLNAIDGLCTKQSCAGHRHSRSLKSGSLWIRLTETLTRAFDKAVFDLSMQADIDRVQKIYQHYGEEIIDIDFRGDERGTLEQAARALLTFFGGLHETAR